MPHQRSKSKRKERWDRLEAQTPAAQAEWLSQSARRQQLDHAEKSNREEKEQLQYVARNQQRTEEEQRAIHERQAAEDRRLREREQQVGLDAQRAKLLRFSAIAGRMVSITESMRKQLEVGEEDIASVPDDIIERRISRLDALAYNLNAEAQLMRTGIAQAPRAVTEFAVFARDQSESAQFGKPRTGSTRSVLNRRSRSRSLVGDGPHPVVSRDHLANSHRHPNRERCTQVVALTQRLRHPRLCMPRSMPASLVAEQSTATHGDARRGRAQSKGEGAEEGGAGQNLHSRDLSVVRPPKAPNRNELS